MRGFGAAHPVPGHEWVGCGVSPGHCVSPPPPSHVAIHPHMARSCRRARGLSPTCHPAPRATGSPGLVALHQEPPAVVAAGPARGNAPSRLWDAAGGFNTCLPAPPEQIGRLSRSVGSSAWSPCRPPHPCGSTRVSFSPLLSTEASRADTASAWETGCRLVGRRRSGQALRLWDRREARLCPSAQRVPQGCGQQEEFVQLAAAAGCASSRLQSRKQLGCPTVACCEQTQLRRLLWMPTWEIPLSSCTPARPGGIVSAPQPLASCSLGPAFATELGC